MASNDTVARKSRPAPESFDCPNCGAPVRAGAAACRECGSDARTGWQGGEEIDYQSVEVPEGWGPADEAAVDGGTARRAARWRLFVALLLVVALVAMVVLR